MRRVRWHAAIAALCFVALPARDDAAGTPSPIQRSLWFLYFNQVQQPLDVTVDGIRIRDFPGDWPQHFTLQGGGAGRVRDVSPFTVAFIHHALATVVEQNGRQLNLTDLDFLMARAMRQRAMGFMRLFESAPAAPDAGTFGFWPYDADPRTPDLLTTLLMTAWLKGPILGGQRVPINLPIYPSTLAIPSDADVTATTYAAMMDAAALDGAPASPVAFERFFADWRDVGAVPRRVNPWWLPPASGAYLTWLTYRDPPRLLPNDVDLVVNGNVLYALGRKHRLDAPGVTEAVRLINLAAILGIHRSRLEDLTEYYPDNFAFQYVVSRAFREGGVSALATAVQIFASDLERTALLRADGTIHWDKGDPHLNTAFAALTLMNAGRRGALLDGAIRYLESEQNAVGGFDEATFFVGRTDGGQVFEFTSASLTTAMALEAMARHRLGRQAATAATMRDRTGRARRAP
ncbi:MAG TPA: hypothetical protein VFK57_05890 [Vicinamibacterales bacterium]|nr:hypothetical protein [Vicinamibacterales bacterium]